jgi:hypothetical protein
MVVKSVYPYLSCKVTSGPIELVAQNPSSLSRAPRPSSTRELTLIDWNHVQDLPAASWLLLYYAPGPVDC